MILPLLLTAFATAAAAAPYGGAFRQSCGTYSAKVTVAQKQLIARVASERAYRLRHKLWYALPASWPDLSDEQRAFFRELVPAWVPPAAVGGADFFAFHRELIGTLFARFHDKGAPCLEPWEIPAAGQEPKMPGGFNASLHAKLARSLTRFLDPEWLITKSLEDTGNELRSEVFQPLLATYAPPDPKAYASCGLDPDHLSGPEFSSHCEDPKNDWLGSAYSAAANPLYYQVSTLVVRVLAAWEAAHGGPANFDTELGRPAWKTPENFERDVQARLSVLTEERGKANRAKNLPASPAVERDHLIEKLRGIEMALNAYRWKPNP